MSALSDRIRAGRERWVEAGGRKWLIRRPTRLQVGSFSGKAQELVFSCVVGWELKELDIVPGGGALVPPFDPDAFREWAEDDVDLMVALAEQVNQLITADMEKRKDLEKN